MVLFGQTALAEYFTNIYHKVSSETSYFDNEGVTIHAHGFFCQVGNEKRFNPIVGGRSNVQFVEGVGGFGNPPHIIGIKIHNLATNSKRH